MAIISPPPALTLLLESIRRAPNLKKKKQKLLDG
jgi:hypothetical protein